MSDSPAMISATRICLKCGAEIPADAPEGGCPGCLLESGLRLLDEEAVAGVGDSGHQDKPPDAATRSERFAKILGELGDYELLEEVGRGGQGVVFRARQKSLNRTVALKVISLGQWASETHLKRFRREAEAAASLDYPSIVPIYEVGERDGSCYFSMKFVEGGQLDEVVRRTPMPIRGAAELIAKVARTVHYAHEHGILHRDIKPGNILLDAQGEPHLTDFGLARLIETESTVTRTLEVLGTPSYMAPEQARGDQGAAVSSPPNNSGFTRAVDVYGLGAVLYQLLTGHPPFAGGTTYETIQLLLNTEPRQPRQLNPRIDRDLSTICLKCLEKDPKRRYPSAVALAQDLEHWLKHEPIQARRTGVVTRGKKWLQRNPTVAAVMMLSLALLAALGVIVWKSELFRAPPEKSIAVLPFKNLSRDPDNAYFADGVQDEILTDLARVADLKVISRTSTMQYKSEVARNLRKIGRELGTAHVVEGNVQRTGNRLRVSAQLIDARTDQHIWGQTYDRELTDLFAIQTDLAQKIASALQAKLSPTEKARLDNRPTQNPDAYLLFVQAHDYANRIDRFNDMSSKSIPLFEQAIKLDPTFAMAFAGLSMVQIWIYHSSDPIPARREKARLNADEALRLQPDLPEGHLALGFSYYYGDRDYEHALAEFEIAKRGLPNDAQAYLAIGCIQRRQGKWAESTANLEKAATLDPKNTDVLINLCFSYMALRNFETADKMLDRAIAASPQSFQARLLKGYMPVLWKGDLSMAKKVFSSVPPENDESGLTTWSWAWILTLERKFPDALEVLGRFRGETMFTTTTAPYPKAFAKGLIHLLQGDKTKAQAELEHARVVSEKLLREAPEDAARHAQHGLILAALGQKQEAIAEGKRAVELLPESQDALDGPQCTSALAQIYAWTGEFDEAFRLLDHLLAVPNGLTLPTLKLDPIWDPLHSDPRFQKLCEEKQK